MAKAEDDKRAEATNNARARARARAKTRVVGRTKASGAMAKSNEGEVAEAPNYNSAEVRDETLAKTNEAAEATEDVGTKTEQGVRTESKEDIFGLDLNRTAFSRDFIAPSSFFEESETRSQKAAWRKVS